jgi:centromere/kinetochore protein ZW10
METLDEADGFRNTDEPDTFAKCQRCVRQLVHTLTSISHAWKVSAICSAGRNGD